MNINKAFPSNYIKVSDLDGRNAVVTIDRVELETIGQGKDAEEKAVVYFRGKEKGLVLNKTNALSIVEITGSDETDDWNGHRVVLYPSKTDFAGKRVDCIRVEEAPKQTAQKGRPAPPPVESGPDPDFVVSDDDIPF
jgi:hypothetical protein